MMQLTRRSALIAALGLLATPAGAQQVKWNLADAYPPTEFMNVNMSKWGEEVRAATGGNLQVTMHWSGSLFKNPDIKRASQTGQIEMGTQLMQNLGPEKRLFEIDGIPFLVRDYDEAFKLWEVSRPSLEKYMQSQGLRILWAAPWPSQGFYFKKEVSSLADLSGIRQRAYNEMTSRLAQLMNTVPTTVQMTDLPQAMSTGMVQAFNTSPTSAVIYKSWEFVTHNYDTNAWLPKQMVFVNEQAFQKLPAAYQKAVLDTAQIAEKRGWEMSRAEVDVAKKKLAEMGMKVVKPGAALQAEFDKIGQTMVAEWLQKADEDGKTVIAAFNKAVGR